MRQAAVPLLMVGSKIAEFLGAEGKLSLAALAPRRRLSRLKLVEDGDHPAFILRHDRQDSFLDF